MVDVLEEVNGRGLVSVDVEDVIQEGEEGVEILVLGDVWELDA